MPDAPLPGGASPEPPSRPTVARVVPDVTGLDRPFDYIVPPALATRVQIGTLVRVSLARRRIGGWVTALGAPDPSLPVERLLPIAKVTGIGPSAEIISLAAWAGHRWAGRLRAGLPHARAYRNPRLLSDM